MKRNWKKVNNKYIKEGYLYLSFDFLNTWYKELEELNSNKRGGQYKFPNSLIKFGSVLKVSFGIGYRQLSGFLKSLEKYIPLPSSPSYSQINRRFNQLGFDLVNSLVDIEDGQAIAIDSSGIKLFQSGEWIREKHRKRKPFLKLHIAVNVETKQAVSVEITEDSVADNKVDKILLERASKIAKVGTVLEDGAYDNYENWESLTSKGIKPGIRLRRDAKNKGINARAKTVRYIEKVGLDKWKKEIGYGKRWLVEIWYSSFKRRFGEHCTNRKPENIIKELIFKAMLTNQRII
jgi:hypothetical protein